MPDESVTLTSAEAAAVRRAIPTYLSDLANDRYKLEAAIRMEERDQLGEPLDEYRADLAELKTDQEALRGLLTRLGGDARS